MELTLEEKEKVSEEERIDRNDISDRTGIEEENITRFPTKIEFLDKKIKGFYPGLVVLHEAVGSGGREFALSYLYNNIDSGFKLYEVGVTKTVEEMKRELKLIFPEAKSSNLINKLEILSIAEEYFRGSIVPVRWVSNRKFGIDELKKNDNILKRLVDIFDGCPEKSIVFLDSITDLYQIAEKRIGRTDLFDLIKGLKKVCIKKDILLLGLLTSGSLKNEKEEELLEQGDGVLTFEWEVTDGAINRWFYFRKFTGILPILEKEGIAKYSVNIDPEAGFVISKLVRVV